MRPRDRPALSIPRCGQPKAQFPLPAHACDRHEKARVELRTVCGEGVDLVGGVQASAEPIASPPCGDTAEWNHVSLAWCPLALHPQQPRSEIEDQVVPRSFPERPEHDDAELGRRPGDGLLGDVALLVAGEDRPKVPRELPGTSWLVRSCNGCDCVVTMGLEARVGRPESISQPGRWPPGPGRSTAPPGSARRPSPTGGSARRPRPRSARGTRARPGR